MIETWMAVCVGGLYACAFYMLMRRSISKIMVGLLILSNAANLLIFTAGGLLEAAPALVEEGEHVPAGPVADPLAQALILTAIVIGFGVLAFAVVLIHRVHEVLGTDDLDAIERPPE